MKYIEETIDLFSVNETVVEGEEPYCYAHCISSDFAMAGGIAVQFNEHFNMREELKSKYGSSISEFTKCGGICIPMEVLDVSVINDSYYFVKTTVFNLVTKKLVVNKPTYEDLRSSLVKMRDYMIASGLNKVAMPLIGCGIDGLNWDHVSWMIQEIFNETDIEVKICRR